MPLFGCHCSACSLYAGRPPCTPARCGSRGPPSAAHSCALRARPTSPATPTRNRTGIDQRAATAAASCTPRGEATSERSARFTRHLPENSRCRLVYRCACAEMPVSSSNSAASAANSPPRSANRRPSPVIGSTNPAASPARRRPGQPADRASTASGPSDVTVDTCRARAKRARSSGSSANACTRLPPPVTRSPSLADLTSRTTQTFVRLPASGATPVYPSGRMCISPCEVRPSTSVKYAPNAQRRGATADRVKPSADASLERRPSAAMTIRAGIPRSREP